MRSPALVQPNGRAGVRFPAKRIKCLMSNQFEFQTVNTILYCQRWQETVDFYQQCLNLPINFASDWFVEFSLTATARLSVADERRATIKSSTGTGLTLTFQVENIQKAWQNLCE